MILYQFALLWLVGTNLLAIVLTVSDKVRAKKGKWRVPEDTLLCVLQASENSIFKGKDKAETQYRQQLMLYKKMINFSKGKSR